MQNLARYPSKTRPRYPRSRTGCLICRQRRKKCDEAQPACSACQRKRLECHWPAPKNTPNSHVRQYRPIAPAGNDDEQQVQQHQHQRQHRQHGGLSISRQLVAPTPSRPHVLTPQSTSLFRYYISETAGLLQTGPSPKNPFVRCVLPAAQADDTLMHAILAVGGAHLAYNTPDNDEIDIAAQRHYSCAIRGVRNEIASRPLRKQALQRLSLILAFFCRYEVLSGAPSVVLHCHLNAMRQLFSGLEGTGYRPCNAQSLGEMDELVALAYELSTYLSHCNAIFFLAGRDAQVSSSSDALGEQTAATKTTRAATYPIPRSFEGLRGASTFGAVYAGCHDLFSLIPEISQLYNRRLAEEAAGQVYPSQPLRDAFARVQHRIDTWEPGDSPPAPPTGTVGLLQGDPTTFADAEQRTKRCASECVRGALRVYGLVSLQGSAAGPLEKASGRRGPIQTLAGAVFEQIMLLGDTSYHSHLLWAALILGSCMLDPAHQQMVTSALNSTRFQMRHVHIARDALLMLWADQDPLAYGPYGLQSIIGKYGININLI